MTKVGDAKIVSTLNIFSITKIHIAFSIINFDTNYKSTKVGTFIKPHMIPTSTLLTI